MAVHHPYSGLPDYAFWHRAVAGVYPFELDPVVSAPFRFTRTSAVGAAGSCFAQHIARVLRHRGYNYLQAEGAGDFSAQYGNIYTARQLLQLFDRAYNTFRPTLHSWRRPDGQWIDPFRPRVFDGGFASEAEVEAARKDHLSAVRRMFESVEVFIFTLGLTEAWRYRGDGSVLPLPPGVVGGANNTNEYEFVNFTADEVANDLTLFWKRLLSVNPDSKLILTVSPVPLVATYEHRHVLVSTTQSKARLLVAADSVVSGLENASYFPSFEIISNPGNAHRYFEKDLRSVNRAGVAHVMRIFLSHFSAETSSEDNRLDKWDTAAEREHLKSVLCEEEDLRPK